ncbi:glycoside hydrolase family 2 TIM barrel-domain containing protein [Pelagicoccus mobilis]|uniref:Glycoside hydrolase family 2 protein n=1 Tax=Pelagicoccus mobilis TaxID=415221 RepID=A0A934RXS0_9BACT|nr:glycoside hydrolase family 2 TIM barrel-domain containing protein [Pelagicoccus mobilis]MBK1875829.1 glycoside hydrolase family 2 protein [Pelagicoccus mobilis]
MSPGRLTPSPKPSFFLFAIVALLFCQSSAAANSAPSSNQLFNDSWLFHSGEHSSARFPETDDSSWRKLRLPHDAAIEGPFSSKNESRSGSLPSSGVFWYRKHFALPLTDREQNVTLCFEGAMSNSRVWINGHFLGERPNGYIGFEYDVTRYIRFGENANNVIAVRLEQEDLSSRWYPGAGLYRDVRLKVRSPIHLPSDGIYITTPVVSDQWSEVDVRAEVANTTSSPAQVTVEHRVFGPDGRIVGQSSIQAKVNTSDKLQTSANLSIANPLRWEPDAPHLYRLETRVRRDGKVVDVGETTFGIRTIEFSASDGFLLNGVRTQIKGVCLHHDLGPLGAAINRSALERRLEILKEMGTNAVRTSHNPPSPQLLDLCDEMGLLVQVEAFDAWEQAKVENSYSKHFPDWYEQDLRAMIRRDRNHPSVFMWSIGNEILEQTDPQKGPLIAKTLNDICHEEDPTRPTTACFNYYPDPVVNGLAAEVDVVGLNYHPASYQDLLERHPDWIVYGSETASTVSSRGVYHLPIEKYDSHPSHQITSYDIIGPAWAYPPDIEFHFQETNPRVIGEFIWTGFDYIGEPTPFAWDEHKSGGAWPSRSSYFGAIDLCGFPKDRYYLYKSQWNSQPLVHLLPHWNWDASKGETIPVYAFSNCEEVELIANGKSLGRRKVGVDTTPIPVNFYNSDLEVFESKYRLRWDVPYVPGAVKAIGYSDGEIVSEDSIKTAGPAHSLELQLEDGRIHNDGYDLAFVQVHVVDKDGNLCPLADNAVEFEVFGPGEIAAVGNGDPATAEPFTASERKTFNGLCLAIIRGDVGQSGVIQVRAKSIGLESDLVEIQLAPRLAPVDGMTYRSDN